MFPLHFSDHTIRSPLFNVSLLLSKCREVFSTDELLHSHCSACNTWNNHRFVFFASFVSYARISQ